MNFQRRRLVWLPFSQWARWRRVGCVSCFTRPVFHSLPKGASRWRSQTHGSDRARDRLPEVAELLETLHPMKWKGYNGLFEACDPGFWGVEVEAWGRTWSKPKCTVRRRSPYDTVTSLHLLPGSHATADMIPWLRVLDTLICHARTASEDVEDEQGKAVQGT
ncbi:hypothetical protein EVG20_g1343 [Dentipellis fragilis]|uniref:Uncharacterized protein n=1 Tax=Dentipellis fragilis TaxID=205917 RepID=A0A4Y9ZCD5_9AGAM|nr:hypothetical protein EVG20_g1343 [Dentipellis fragilis]